MVLTSTGKGKGLRPITIAVAAEAVRQVSRRGAGSSGDGSLKGFGRSFGERHGVPDRVDGAG